MVQKWFCNYVSTNAFGAVEANTLENVSCCKDARTVGKNNSIGCRNAGNPETYVDLKKKQQSRNVWFIASIILWPTSMLLLYYDTMVAEIFNKNSTMTAFLFLFIVFYSFLGWVFIIIFAVIRINTYDSNEYQSVLDSKKKPKKVENENP